MLDPSIADVVSHAMKDWAIERGATHYTIGFSLLPELPLKNMIPSFPPPHRKER